MYHNNGNREAAEGIDLSAAEAEFRGAEYLQHIEKGVTDQNFRIAFVGEEVTTTLWVASAPGTRVLTADGPGETVLERIPMAMMTREGTSAHFAVVLASVPTAEKSNVRRVSAAQENGNKTVTVTFGDREDVLTFTANGTLSLNVDGKNVLRGEVRD